MNTLSFSGKSGHGKDFCADIAVKLAWEEFGVRAGRFSFAWPLKARVYGEANLAYPIEDVLYNKPPELRKLLQEVGTERGREVFGAEFWTLQAEAMLRLMSDAMPDIQLWVFSDCRFPNEADFVRLGGHSVGHLSTWSNAHRRAFVDAGPGQTIWIDSNRPTLTGAAAKHVSETALDAYRREGRFSGPILNDQDTTRDELAIQIRPFVRRAIHGK